MGDALILAKHGLVRCMSRTSFRCAVAGVSLIACLGVGVPAQARDAFAGDVRAVEVQSRPIPHFRASAPQQRRFGRLEYRGGIVLTSSDADFGGWSGLVVEGDGKRMMAVSDAGAWLSAEIVYRDGAPVGLAKARMGPVLALKGRRLDTKRDLDAESMTTYSGDLTRGTVLIGFERNHRIGVFPVENGALMAPVRYLPLPPEARRMRSNSGFEALAVLRGGPFKGSVLAFSERFPGPTETHVGWIWVRGTPQRLTLTDHGGFNITDAATLPDGTLFLLERRFRWTEGVKMRLRRIAAEAIKPGAALDGEILLEADLSSQIDNMEGLAVHRGAGGETILTVISDNNFNTFLQRNMLLQFVLAAESTAASDR